MKEAETNHFHFPITMDNFHSISDVAEEIQSLLHHSMSLQARQFMEWNEDIIRQLQTINVAILEHFGGEDE